MTLKIADIDGVEQQRVLKKKNKRVIEFGTRIKKLENQNWTNFLDIKHNRKFVIHSILAPKEEREEDEETNEETSVGIGNKKLNAVSDASMLYNQMEDIGK